MRTSWRLLFLIFSAARAAEPAGVEAAPGRWRAELSMERYKRDIEQETRQGPDTFVARQREDRLWLRGAWGRDGWEVAALAGVSDARESLDPVPAFGLEGELRVLGDEQASLTLFAEAVVVHGVEYRNLGGQIGPFVIADDTREESHMEFGGGFRWDWTLDLGRAGVWRPYTGLLFTGMKGEGEEAFAFPEGAPVQGPRRGANRDVDFREDGVLGAVLGTRLVLPAGFALRLETRLVDRSIYSAGISRAF